MDMFSEKISPGKNLLVGFQHVLAMCPGTIAVPLIMGGAMGLDARTTAFLVSANLFTSGIAILQAVYGNHGGGLPDSDPDEEGKGTAEKRDLQHQADKRYGGIFGAELLHMDI